MPLTVYYESLCPDSAKFISEQLYPALKGPLKDYVDVMWHPFGKSKVIAHLFLSLSLSFSLSLSLSPSVSLTVPLSIPLPISLCFSLSSSPSLDRSLYLSVSLSLSLFVSLSLSITHLKLIAWFYFFYAISTPLKEPMSYSSVIMVQRSVTAIRCTPAPLNTFKRIPTRRNTPVNPSPWTLSLV